jgi:MOSC domain-containing protein YiiM
VQLIGSVVRLQVQLRSLKVGERPRRWYDPAPIAAVPRLALDERGVTGWDGEGNRLDDVHNLSYPGGRNRGNNHVSVGFTSHYGAMRRRFGTHLRDGIAGENILVATGLAGGLSFADAELTGALAIETESGLVTLTELSAAEPCAEFSRFALGADPAEDAEGPAVREALQFLRRGMRGYYAAHATPGTVELGDLVYRL